MLLRLYKNGSSYVDLPIAIHINKPIESIIYKSSLDEVSSIPISYLESEDINAKKNINIRDRSISIESNSPQNSFDNQSWQKIKGSSYNTNYNNLLISDKAIFDFSNIEKPLWYCMKFSKNIVSIQFEEFTKSKKNIMKFGYEIAESRRKVYFDFNNSFNPITKDFKLYFFTVYFDDNTVSKGLINPISSVYEATWEDIDSDGNLVEGQAYWTKEQIGNYYTYTFSESNTYYIKTDESSFISPLELNQNLPDDGWFLNINVGHFNHIGLDGVLREYKIPEYENLSFNPSRPYMYDSYTPISLITKKILYLGRKNLGINNTNRPLEIIISNKDGTPVKALTTKLMKNNTKYNSTILWDADSILSYDNKNGIVELAFDIQDNQDLRTSLFYEAKSYIYTEVNLNPIYNENIYNHYYVYYLVPDQTERAIHHLTVRNDGIIVDTSEESRKLVYNDLYNENTYVGLTYRNSTNALGDWVSLYSCEIENDYQYLIIAEANFVETLPTNGFDSISLKREAFQIKESALYHNPRIQQSAIGSSLNGLQYPKNLAYVVKLSYSLLEDYGGEFTIDEIKEDLYRFVAAGKLLILEWDEAIYTLECSNETANEIVISWPMIDSSFTYNLYRSSSEDGEYELISNISVDNYNQCSYIDTGLTSGQVYYYYIKPTKDSIEYPKSNIIGIEVR